MAAVLKRVRQRAWRAWAAVAFIGGLALAGALVRADDLAGARETPIAGRLDPGLGRIYAAWTAAEAGDSPWSAMLPGLSEPTPPTFHVDERLLAQGRVRVQLDTGPQGKPAAALRPACEAALRSLTWEYDSGVLAQVVLDIADLPALTRVPGLFYALRPPVGVVLQGASPGGETEQIVSAGVAECGADAFHAAGYRGEGVRVGVLDVCFEGALELIGTELPLDTKVRLFGDCTVTGTTRRHGTSCAEILHDVAPGAGLRLTNATTLLEMQAATRWLREEGVSIITHSVGWYWGPGDGTGAIAEVVVEEAVDRGIVWVNAAGNQAERYWGGSFLDQDGDGVHEFDASGDESLTLLDVPQGTDFRFVLTWDRWPYSQGLGFEVDLYLNGERFATSGDASNPTIYAYRDVAGRTSAAGTVEVVIRRSAGTDAARLRLCHVEDFDLQEHRIAAGSLILPADSPRVLSVGAYRRSNGSAVLESFSSRGPTQAGVAKPELCALDNVATAGINPFQGTSAAAPLVAGLAALLLQAAPQGGFFDFRWEMPELFDLLAWAAQPAGFADANACVWGLAHLPSPTDPPAGPQNLLLVTSPVRGDLRVAFRRPVTGPALLEVFDPLGRRVGHRMRILPAREGEPLAWGAGPGRAAGVYYLVACGPGWSARTPFLFLP